MLKRIYWRHDGQSLIRTALILLVALFGASQSSHAQDTDDTQQLGPVIEYQMGETPNYLEPISETADLNLLGMIFGDIARSAAGQIELADATLPNPTSDLDSHETDSVLAAANFVYMLGILGVLSIFIIFMGIIWLLSSGMEAKLITQRYNMWIPIRAGYAIIAIVPIIGGWSLGQYSLLNATFLVNGITNEVHQATNQWVYSHEGVLSTPFYDYHYRDLVETIYLGEICSQMANTFLDHEEEKLEQERQLIDARLNNGNYGWKIDQRLMDDYRSTILNTINIDDYSGVEIINKKAGDSVSFEQRPIIVTGYVPPPREDMSFSTHQYSYGWGSSGSTPTSCGQITFNIPVPQMSGLTGTNGDIASSPRRREFVEAHWNAHIDAITDLIGDAHTHVASVKSKIQTALNNNPAAPYKKKTIQDTIQALGENDQYIRAFGAAFSDHGTVTSKAWDGLVAGETSDFGQKIKSLYNSNTKSALQDFNDQLEKLQDDVRDGTAADYSSTPTDTDTTPYHSLVQNTQKGWMYAGFKWWDLSHATSFQLELKEYRPSSRNFTATLNEHKPIIRKALNVFEMRVDRAKSLVERGSGASFSSEENLLSARGMAQWAEDAESDPGSALQNYHNAFAQYLHTNVIGSVYDFKTRDLLANLQNAGHNYLVTGELLLGATALTRFSAAAVEGVGDSALSLLGANVLLNVLLEFLNMIGGLLYWAGIVFFVAGIVLAIYLPMLPAMLWTFGLIGWLEKLISLIINSGAWFAGHIIPDQDGVVNGVGRQGYILLASVLLRPPVMVLSLNFSMVALAAFGTFLDDFVNIFIPSTSQGYLNGPVTLVAQFAVFTIFIVVVCHAILAWIWKIPDEIPVFISGGASNFGEGESKTHLQGAIGHVGGKTEQIGGSMGAGGGGGENPNKQSAPGNNNDFVKN